MSPMSRMFHDLDRRRVLAWASYDWANSAFATTVMAAFLPVFFPSYWSDDVSGGEALYRLGSANSLAGLLVALVAPLLGAVADRGGLRKRLLALFALLGVVMSVGLAFASRGEWQLALFLYVIATVGFSGSNIFYDSLIGEVSPPQRLDFVSAFGFAAGYLGGGLLFVVNVLMVSHPGWFGLADEPAAVKASFLMVGVWWAVFTLPVLLFVPETRPPAIPLLQAVRHGVGELRRTFGELRRHRTAFGFLLGYWLYIDGVDTIVRMAGTYGATLGLPSTDLIKALLVTQFVGFPATLLFGVFGQRVGAKVGIGVGILVYIAVTIWAYFLTTVWEFYLLAVVIGLVQGGVQSLSRSFFQRLIPRDRTAQFFGLYNMAGKFAVVIGPWLMGITTKISGSERTGILALLPLFIIGALLALRVKVDPRPAADR